VRAVDRLHRWSEEFADLAERSPQTEAVHQRRAMIFEQLDQLTSRARLLQRSLAACYVSLGFFVATSAAIAVVALGGLFQAEWQRVAILPVILSLAGAGALFYSCLLLVREAGLALRSTDEEMDYLWSQGMRNAPEDLIARLEARRKGLPGLRRLDPRLQAAALRGLGPRFVREEPDGDIE